MSIYRTADGKRALERVYDVAVDRLDVDVEETRVGTRHGSTHVLLAGPEDGPPIFVFHGGNATNPMTLAWYTDLADEYRLIAPDTVGHPGKSAETRLDPDGDEYGEWAVDVLDAFEVDAAPMIGTSYGAGIIVRTGAYAPDRIERAALVVPAGFGTGPIIPLVKIGLASVCYRFLPRDRLLEYVISALVTEADSDHLARSTIGASLRHVALERAMPDSTAEELEGLSAPVSLYLGAEDPFFPPDAIVPRARARLPTVSHVESLPGEKHILSSAARDAVSEHVREFFDAERGTEGA